MTKPTMPIEALSRRFHEVPALQLPGRPERLRHVYIGGPEDPADRRLQLPLDLLLKLVEVAKASEANIAVIDQVGLEVSTWQDSSGHRFEQVTIRGLEPKPKRVSLNMEIGSPGSPIPDRVFKGDR